MYTCALFSCQATCDWRRRGSGRSPCSIEYIKFNTISACKLRAASANFRNAAFCPTAQRKGKSKGTRGKGTRVQFPNTKSTYSILCMLHIVCMLWYIMSYYV